MKDAVTVGVELRVEGAVTVVVALREPVRLGVEAGVRVLVEEAL